MKKLILVGAIALFGTVNAQTFGVKAGMNLSTVSGTDAGLDLKSKVGFNAGVFMNAPLATNFSIQPEVLYNNLGAKTKGAIDATVHLDYISVPVMLQYNATPELYLEAGPEFGFLVDSRVNADDPAVQAAGNALVDKSNLHSFNFGVGIGAGYYFTPNIGLTARYVAGFTDIAKNRASNDNSTAKNNIFQIGLAYKFAK